MEEVPDYIYVSHCFMRCALIAEISNHHARTVYSAFNYIQTTI